MGSYVWTGTDSSNNFSDPITCDPHSDSPALPGASNDASIFDGSGEIDLRCIFDLFLATVQSTAGSATDIAQHLVKSTTYRSLHNVMRVRAS